MKQEIRKFLHDEIADLLELSGSKVIWNRQDGYKQAVPLVTLMAYSEQGEAMAEILPTGHPGKLNLKTPTGFVLEVQYFGAKGTFPTDILSDLARQWSRPTVLDKSQLAGVAFLYADPVQDLTGLLGNDQQYEPRAAVDLHFRYTAEVIDNPGYIDTVEVHGETPKNLDFTVSAVDETPQGTDNPGNNDKPQDDAVIDDVVITGE